MRLPCTKGISIVFRSVAVIVGLLIAATPPSVAASKSTPIKSWVFNLYDDGSAGAFTENDSHSSLGLYCSTKQNCLVYLASGDGCDEGSKVPILMNAGSGALPLNATCKNIANPGAKPLYVMVIDNLDDVLNVILKDHTIGFAIPFANGQFKVVRFSLEGSNEAIAAVNDALNKAGAKPASNRDTVL